MSSKKLWFGHADKHMQWVPAPLAGAESQNVNHIETIEFENGGADIYRSRQYRKQYDFEFSAPVEGSDNLGVFNKFASGYFGGGLIHFADPYIFRTNMLSGVWATPGLIERGWKNIYDTEPTISTQQGAILRRNLVPNPSFEIDTQGWSNTGGTIARVTTEFWVGVASLQLVAGAIDEVAHTIPSGANAVAATPGSTYVYSTYLKGEATKLFRVEIIFRDSAGVQVGGTILGADTAADGTWQRLQLSPTTAPAGAAYAQLFIRNRTAGAHTLYADGVQFEVSSTVASAYFDGSSTDTRLLDYAWTGSAHLSVSTEREIFPRNEQPRRRATWNVTSAANAKPTKANSIFVVPIPPDHTLHLGASGSATGTAAVMVEPVYADGTSDAPFALTLLDPNLTTRMNATVSGATYASVRIYITRTTADTSTITLTSLMAQLWKIGSTVTLPSVHIPGDGHSGLEFLDDARVETYTYIDPPRKAMSTTLMEVGAWR